MSSLLFRPGWRATDQELVQYLEERFDRQAQGFHGLLNERFERQERRFNARFEEVNARLDERIEEVKRHTGVLVEGLRHEIQLVAESLATHIQVQQVQEREYHDQQDRETRALIRSFYDELRQQDEHIRQRVEHLERKSPN